MSALRANGDEPLPEDAPTVDPVAELNEMADRADRDADFAGLWGHPGAQRAIQDQANELRGLARRIREGFTR